jgi:hypothetical protein
MDANDMPCDGGTSDRRTHPFLCDGFRIMAICEYCWSRRLDAEEYWYTIHRAEREGWPCTKDTEEGARLRAGQFWDEATKTDRRFHAATTKSAVESLSEVERNV